jgi:hypothetical protein
MIRHLVLFLIGLCICLSAHSDSSPPAKIQARTSSDGRFVVRIVPGNSMGDVFGYAGQAKGPYARAEWYIFTGNSYRLLRQVTLLNPIAPLDMEVTKNGTLVTIDNWHNKGIGNVVVIYSSSGDLVKQFKLTDLYSPTDFDKISKSTSNIHWRCGEMSTILDSDMVMWIDDSLGGRFKFKLETGKFEYERAAAGNLCR